MEGLFRYSPLNEPIGCWDVSSVTNMIDMFAHTTNFNQAIVNWNVSKVTDMRYMFGQASSFNQVIGNWDVSRVTNISYIFMSATKFNQDLCAWYNKLKNITSINNTLPYSGCTNPEDPDFRSKASFCQACTCSAGKF
jgi:surface protein